MTYTSDSTHELEQEALLTKWTPLRRMVDERGFASVLSEMHEVAGLLVETGQLPDLVAWHLKEAQRLAEKRESNGRR